MGKGQKYLSFFSKISSQKRGFFLASSILLLILGLANWTTIFSSKIDFNSQVKPIFNKRCIHCHGGVKKNGGFSLMTRAQALSPTESGKPAIVPGKPNDSELIHRILAADPEVRMPSEAAPLPKEEINILRKWIKQGADIFCITCTGEWDAVRVGSVGESTGEHDAVMTSCLRIEKWWSAPCKTTTERKPTSPPPPGNGRPGPGSRPA